MKVGDTVETDYLNFDRESVKMSLRWKQLTADPWTTVMKKYTMVLNPLLYITSLTRYLWPEESVDGFKITSLTLSWSKN